MIPNPYNNAGLIMQGFQSLGQAGDRFAQMREQEIAKQKLQQPVAPEIEAYAKRRLEDAMRRMEQGGNPQVEAQNYYRDVQQFLQQGGQRGVPQVQMPNVVGQAVGPSSPVQTSAFSGAPMQPAPGGMAPPATAPAPRSAFSGPAQGPAVTPQLEAAFSAGDASRATPRAPGAIPMDQTPIPYPETPRPAPQAPAAPPQRIQQTQPAAAPPQPQQRMTREQLADYMSVMPAVEAQGREESARVQAQTRLQVASMNNDAKAAFLAVREAGLNERAADKLVVDAQRITAKTQVDVFRILQDLAKARLMASTAEGIAGMKVGTDRYKVAADTARGLIESGRKLKEGALFLQGEESANALQIGEAAIQSGFKLSNELGLTSVSQTVEPGTPPTPGTQVPIIGEVGGSPGTPDKKRVEVGRPNPPVTNIPRGQPAPKAQPKQEKQIRRTGTTKSGKRVVEYEDGTREVL